MMKILVGVAVAVVVAAIVATVMKSAKQKGHLTKATAKMRELGVALESYVADSNGLLPLEDAPGKDDWITAAKPEAVEAWYNVLPKRMSAASVAELGDSPEDFYLESYPLFIPGAPYPKSDKKLKRPYFALGMNSRLQRKDEEGNKVQTAMASIVSPGNTVVFLERGIPGDEKVSKIQSGFDAAPKANAGNFATRHNQKGIILFADGHTAAYQLSDVVDKSGRVKVPQETLIWTADPSEDPN